MRGLVGATVSRAIAGFSGRGAIRTVDIVEMPSRPPVRIEVVDTMGAINRVLPDLCDIVEGGLGEVQETQVVRASAGGSGGIPPDGRPDLGKVAGKGQLLEVHVGADDTFEGRPLYEAIVKRALLLDVSGATVRRGILGYSAQDRLHGRRALALSSGPHWPRSRLSP